jgi:HAD superfamily hydrolase (TIGR01549 family)
MFKNKKVIEKSVSAVLWDFDGTISDSMSKHFLIHKKMYSLIKPNVKKKDLPDVLSSLDKFKEKYKSIHWLDLLKQHFCFSKKQIEQVKIFWGDLVSKTKTPVKIFEGLHDVFEKIKLPHGICSQNCSKNIKNILQKNEIDHHFQCIVGSNDIENQKPHPDSFVYCVENMKIKSGVLFYVGDHNVDIMFAKNAEIALKEKGYYFKIFSIVACYSGADTKFWNVKPDFEAYKPEDISKIILEKRIFSKV